MTAWPAIERCWFGIAFEDEGLRCPNRASWKPRLAVPDRWCDEHRHDGDVPVLMLKGDD